MAAALLTRGTSVIGNLGMCSDTRSAMKAIADLGARTEHTGDGIYEITGGLAPRTDIINIGESGLAARMFTPIASLSPHRITVVGEGSMLRRPVGMMIRPLERLGVKVESDGFLPFSVQGPLRGGTTDVDGYVSSQFITGLLLAAPLAKYDTTLYVSKPASTPYIAMTVDAASRFGIRIEHDGFREFFIEGSQTYRPARFDIEGDWSSAAFMLAAGALTGSVTVGNMNTLSLQADTALVSLLSAMGAEITTTDREVTARRRNLLAFDFDATDCPDLFPVLAVMAACCTGRSVIRGVKRLEHKESDRALAIVEEFGEIGIKVEIENEDYMAVEGRPIEGGTVDSRGDHRIAMAGAVAGLVSRRGVTVQGAESVEKSYPGFWDDLSRLTGIRYE